MRRNIEIDELISKPFFGCKRVLNMAIFSFGRSHKARNFSGDLRTVAEFALHVQCEWQLHKHTDYVISSKDISSQLDESGTTAFDRKVVEMKQHKLIPITVTASSISASGIIEINFETDYRLIVKPNHRSDDEQWRFFKPYDADVKYLVFENGAVQDY